MVTTNKDGLETLDERLTRIKISRTLCLGTHLEMTTNRILREMSDGQIKRMFNENLDAQYVLLDSQGYEDNKSPAISSK